MSVLEVTRHLIDRIPSDTLRWLLLACIVLLCWGAGYTLGRFRVIEDEQAKMRTALSTLTEITNRQDKGIDQNAARYERLLEVLLSRQTGAAPPPAPSNSGYDPFAGHPLP